MSTLPLSIGFLLPPAEPGVDFVNQCEAGVRRLPDSRFCKSLYKHSPCLPLPVRFIGRHGGVAFSELPADFWRGVSNQQLIVFGGIQDTQESFVDTICRYFMGILHWNRVCTEIDPKLRTALYEAVVYTDVLQAIAPAPPVPTTKADNTAAPIARPPKMSALRKIESPKVVISSHKSPPSSFLLTGSLSQ